MTSISSGTSLAAMLSPGDRMKQQLASAVSSGKVKAADQTALASALQDIDTAMKAGGGSSATGTSSTTGRRHAGGKEKIDGVIDQEVTDGKLTSDQATELKKLFADAAPKMHGAHGAGGPPPLPSTDTASDDSDTSLIDSLSAASASSSSSATGSTASTSDPVTTLVDFLKTLRTANADKTVYGSNGTSTTNTLQSMLVDTAA